MAGGCQGQVGLLSSFPRGGGLLSLHRQVARLEELDV